jgi:hypothetical protein
VGGVPAGGGGHLAAEDMGGASITGLASGAGMDVGGAGITGLVSGAGMDVGGAGITGLASGAGMDVGGAGIAGLVSGAGMDVGGAGITGLVSGAGCRGTDCQSRPVAGLSPLSLPFNSQFRTPHSQLSHPIPNSELPIPNCLCLPHRNAFPQRLTTYTSSFRQR